MTRYRINRAAIIAVALALLGLVAGTATAQGAAAVARTTHDSDVACTSLAALTAR
jgi:hypothetical protein